MLQFTVLNPVINDDRDAPKEIQVERALDVYNRSLVLMQKGRNEEARSVFEELLQRDVLRDTLPPGSGAHSSPAHGLRFAVHKNYAFVLEAEGKLEKAYFHYKKASSIDSADASLWCKIGELAARLGRWDESCQAYLCGKDRTTVRSLRFQCLDGIVNALYEFGDFSTCLQYIKEGLELNPEYPRGLWIKEQILADRLVNMSLTSLLYTEITPQDMLEHLSMPPLKVDSSARRPRQPQTTGVANVEHDSVTLTLNDVTSVGLGNLLLGTYRSWARLNTTDSRESDVSLRRHIHFQTDTDADEVVPAEIGEDEKAEVPNANLTQEMIVSDPPDAEPMKVDGDAEESEQSAKKRRHSEAEDLRRTSKRVRTRMEQELQQKDVDDKDLGEVIDALLPQDVAFSSRADGLVPDTDGFLSAFCSKILSTATPTEQKRKTKCSKKARKARTQLDVGIAETLSTDAVFSSEKFKAFAASVSSNNSGLLDVMRQFITWHMIGHTSPKAKPQNHFANDHWPQHVYSIVTSMLLILEKHDSLTTFLRDAWPSAFGLQAASTQDTAEASEAREAMEELLISSAELLCDAWINQAAPNGTQIEFPTDFEVEEDENSIDRNPLTQLSMLPILQRLNNAIAEIVAASDKGQDVVLIRYAWVQGRMSEHLQDDMGASQHYEVCRKAIHNAARLRTGNLDVSNTYSVELMNCVADNVISLATLQQKFAAVEARRYVLDAGDKFAREEYQAVIQRLKPVFINPSKSDVEDGHDEGHQDTELIDIAKDFLFNSYPFSKRTKLLDNLRLSCEKVDDEIASFICSVHNLIDAVCHATTEPDLEGQLELMAESCDRCIQFISTRSHGEPLWDEILRAQLGHGRVDSSFDTLLDQFIGAVSSCMRLTWSYMKNHAEMPSAVRRPAIARRLKALNVFSIRSWILSYHVVQLLGRHHIVARSSEQHEDAESIVSVHSDPGSLGRDSDAEDGGPAAMEIPKQTSPARPDAPAALKLSPENPDFLAEMLFIGHEELGKRGLCGFDNGRYLKLILQHVGIQNDDAYRSEAYQCYHCLYGIRVDHGLHLLAEHFSSPVTFDQEAASAVFKTVSEQLDTMLALRAGRGIPGDVKQCLDKVTEVFSKPPWTNAKVLFNKEAIDSFLARPINVLEVAPNRKTGLVSLDFSEEERKRIPDVYFNLFHLQGRLLYSQYKARTATQTYSTFYKTIDILTAAAEQFLFDLHLTPDRMDSWLSLALCYVALANEHLSNSATLIIEAYGKIRDWQKRAFHCFAQACQLSSITAVTPETVTLELATSLWGEFGFLCHGIASRPMNGAATSSNSWKIREIWAQRAKAVKSATGQVVDADILADGSADDAVAHEANMNKSRTDILALGAYCFKKARELNSKDWRYSYMLGNIYAKLRAAPQRVIRHYRKAVALVPAEWTTKEQEKILDPAVKLVGYLIKSLHRNSISPEEAIAAIRNLADQTGAIPASIFDNLPAAETHPDMRQLTFKNVFSLILTLMKPLNVYQHKPIYRQAWLYYHEIHNAEHAKTVLLSLFKLRDQNSKKFVHFWKSEFERPGKHFMSVHKYIAFLAKLLEETDDVDGLRRLCRKVRKAEEVLLWPDRIWRIVFTACFKALHATSQGAHNLSLSGSMSKTEFDLRAPDVEYQMFAAADPKPVRLQNLLCAFELKKLNDGFMDEEDLDLFLVETYSSLFSEFGGGPATMSSAPPTGEGIMKDSQSSTVFVEDSNGSEPVRMVVTNGDPMSSPMRDNAPTYEKLRFAHVLQRVQHVCRFPPQVLFVILE
ncbi:hypothetical protein DFJ77DRAFT_325707 [Powellomyces hirtus]|nr:hypothetical protein DFJ77DRAFT_325707 [Powellomyces hirtus]